MRQVLNKKTKIWLYVAVFILLLSNLAFYTNNRTSHTRIDDKPEGLLANSAFTAPNFFKISSSSLTLMTPTRDIYFDEGTASASADFSFDVGLNIFTASGSIDFYGEIRPDGATCGVNEILKRTGANNWDCAADDTGAAAKAFGWIDANNSGGTFVSIGSLSFDAGHFTFSNTASEGYLRLDWDSVASLSTAETIAGNWVNTTNPWADNEVIDTLTVTGGTIGANNISGTQTTTGTLTIGDNGDSIIIDASNWDVSTLGKADFLSASVSTNFEVGGTASISAFNLPDKDGGLLGDCEASTDKLVYDVGTKKFNCGTDATGGGGGTQIEIQDGSTDIGSFSSVSFEANSFVVTDTTGEALIRLDWDSVASLSTAETIVGNWVNTDNPWADNEVIDTITASNYLPLAGGTLTGGLFGTAASFSGVFEFTNYASASVYRGGGLTDCDSDGSQLLWDTTLGKFSCQTLADADIPDTITITNLSGTNTGDVTLAGTPNYLTLSGQAITLTKLDISDDTNATGGVGVDIIANDFTFDATELSALTWSAGGSATFAWTINLSGTDPVLTFGSALFDFTGGASFSKDLETSTRFIANIASISNYRLPLTTGGALGDCDADGDTLNWDTTTGRFICGTDGGGGVASNSLGYGAWVDFPVLDANYTLASGGFNWNWGNVDVIAGTGIWDLGGASSFEIPNAAGGTTVNVAGQITFDTASKSLNGYDGTAEKVIAKAEKCFTYAYQNPTAKDQWGGKRFRDPFTITSVEPIASGSNAAGWNMRHGQPGTVTTDLFTANHSASISTYPTYTTFNDATLIDGEVLDLVITSASAVLKSINVNVCGNYDP